jgi:hypothetical protein
MRAGKEKLCLKALNKPKVAHQLEPNRYAHLHQPLSQL